MGLSWGDDVGADATPTRSWAPIIDFLDDQHETYMRQEQQPQRGDKVDMRVHACLYFVRPTGHTCVASLAAWDRIATDPYATQAQAARH